MSKKTIVTVIGSLVILIPFVGLPKSFENVLFVIFGASLIYIARARKKTQ